MRFCNILTNDKVTAAVVRGKSILLLPDTSLRLGKRAPGESLDDLLLHWPGALEWAAETVERAEAAGDWVEAPQNGRILAPVRRPGTFRDFYAFETHVRNARRLRGLDINPEWYEAPVFYFSNPNTIKGPGELIRFPKTSRKWDYELEVGAVLGGGGSDLTPEEAEARIAGFTIINDWSARDIQRREMASSMGPAKGKDFATSVGPFLVTPDEIADRREGKGYNLKMTGRVNGNITSEGNWNTIFFSFGEMISRASQDAAVYPGELFGSGTVGNGCLLEHGFDHDHWLKPGEVVELEVERLGTLVNPVG